MGAVICPVGWGACLHAVGVETDRSELAAARRRRLVALGLLQSPAMTVVLVAL